MTKHTPGPWILEDYGDGEFSLSSESAGTRNFDGDFKRHITGTCWSKQHGNLRLIAAAPDLLAALRDLTNDVEKVAKDSFWSGRLGTFDDDFATEDPDGYRVWKNAMDAIRKATS